MMVSVTEHDAGAGAAAGAGLDRYGLLQAGLWSLRAGPGADPRCC